jgi:hypothetical protein
METWKIAMKQLPFTLPLWTTVEILVAEGEVRSPGQYNRLVNYFLNLLEVSERYTTISDCEKIMDWCCVYIEKTFVIFTGKL